MKERKTKKFKEFALTKPTKQLTEAAKVLQTRHEPWGVVAMAHRWGGTACHRYSYYCLSVCWFWDNTPKANIVVCDAEYHLPRRCLVNLNSSK